MKREYYGYFTAGLRDLVLGRYWRHRIDSYLYFEQIESIFSEVPDNWRPDARFFLINNMIDMVILPYDAINGRGYSAYIDDSVRQLIIEDLKLLIRRSEEVARERKREYVSATSVAIALGDLAESLKTTSLQIWGPDESD